MILTTSNAKEILYFSLGVILSITLSGVASAAFRGYNLTPEHQIRKLERIDVVK